MNTLEIKNLHVSIDNKPILKGVDLVVNEKEVHALMGPNGNGKSTLLAAIMGHPKYEVTEGTVTLNGENVLEMEVNERAKAGLFLGMQYPQEINGVTISDFMKAALNTRSEKPIPLFTFIRSLDSAIKKLEMKSEMAHRYVNEVFSGGEKKRNEIMQMMLLKPKFAMLDEIDSGLDVDAIKVVAKVLNEQIESSNMGTLIVSHYDRFYQMVQPTHAHVLIDGKIVVSGGRELATKVDEQGYDWLQKEFGIEIKEEKSEVVRNAVGSLGTCAVKELSDVTQ